MRKQIFCISSSEWKSTHSHFKARNVCQLTQSSSPVAFTLYSFRLIGSVIFSRRLPIQMWSPSHQQFIALTALTSLPSLFMTTPCTSRTRFLRLLSAVFCPLCMASPVEPWVSSLFGLPLHLSVCGLFHWGLWGTSGWHSWSAFTILYTSHAERFSQTWT